MKAGHLRPLHIDRTVAGLVWVIAAVGLIAAVAAVAAYITMPSTLVLLMIAGTALAIVPFALGLRRFDCFEPVYLYAVAYFALFVAHPAAEEILYGGPPLVSGYDPGPTLGAAMLIGVVGTCAFYAGYYSPFGAALIRPSHRAGRSWNHARLSLFAALAMVLVMVTFLVFLVTSGGASTVLALLSGRNDAARAIVHQSSGYLVSAPLWLAPVGVVLLALAQRWRSGLGLAGLSLILVSQLVSISEGDRSWTLPVVAAITLVHFLKQGRRPSLGFIVGALLVVFIFGLTVPRDFRNTADRTGSLTDALSSSVTHPADALGNLFGGADTGMVDDLAIELTFVPSFIPYAKGSSYVEALARPVPRQIWAGKPTDADTTLMSTIWPDLARQQVGFAFSAFGEPYLNAGFLGVGLFGFAFGVAWRAAYAWLCRSVHDVTTIALYALSWPFLLVYFRGGVGVDYHRQAIYLIPVFLAIAFASKRGPATRSPIRVTGELSPTVGAHR